MEYRDLGERPEFSSLAVNNGGQFPETDFLGTLTGTLFGETAFIRIELPGTNTFLAISIDGSQADRLVGRTSLLPEQRFDGRFEAIRQ